MGKEANEMELRLKNLQERMLKQNAEDTATPKFGGSRWKSARPDKGSVLSYAKDVHEKHRKTNNGDDPAMRPHDAPRSAPLKEKIIANFRNKGKFQFLKAFDARVRYMLSLSDILVYLLYHSQTLICGQSVM